MADTCEHERLALLYSDGSMGILVAGATIEQARQDAIDSDVHETVPEHFTRVAKVRIVVEGAGETPSALRGGSDACPSCGRAHPKRPGGARG